MISFEQVKFHYQLSKWCFLMVVMTRLEGQAGPPFMAGDILLIVPEYTAYRVSHSSSAIVTIKCGLEKRN